VKKQVVRSARKSEGNKRSELVFQALIQVPNPFWLCQLTSQASRRLYRTANVSSSSAINEALELLARKPELRETYPIATETYYPVILPPEVCTSAQNSVDIESIVPA
jgi:hypothetical protein